MSPLRYGESRVAESEQSRRLGVDCLFRRETGRAVVEPQVRPKPGCVKCRIRVPSRRSATPSKITSSPIWICRPDGIRILPPRYTSAPTGTLPSGKRVTDRWALPLLTLRLRHTWDHESPSLRNTATRAASTLARGRPNFLPLARAFLRPARTRSRMRSRSSCATADTIVKSACPRGEVVSIFSW